MFRSSTSRDRMIVLAVTGVVLVVILRNYLNVNVFHCVFDWFQIYSAPQFFVTLA